MSLDLAQTKDQPLARSGSPDSPSFIAELVAFFRSAERPSHGHLVGLEHEKLLFARATAEPVPYEGAHGVGALLERLALRGQSEFREAPGLPVIALTRGSALVSLEPGGQLELSGTPARTAREVHAENLQHLGEVTEIAKAMGLAVVPLGYRPFGTVSEMPWMPKTRYATMRETLGTRGRLAYDMMLMTATGQVSLDWSDEADCARKVTLAARATPLIVALYANSPLAAGRPTGFQSYRSRVWSEVDSARCGYFPAMLDGSFSYRKYIEWALRAPMLFLRRQGRYLHPRITFGELLEKGFEGQPAMYSDWVDHLSTLFPEVRIKRVLEIRGADSVSPGLTGALAALMRGLLYDSTAMDEAERLLPRFTFEQHLLWHQEAQRNGLDGTFEGTPLVALARGLVEIARAGLGRLDPADLPVLEPLREVAASGRSPAKAVLEAFGRAPSPTALVEQFAV